MTPPTLSMHAFLLALRAAQPLRLSVSCPTRAPLTRARAPSGRSAAKLAGLELPAAGAQADLPRGVHASAAAALAWRTAQLLSALPRRGTEAAAWAHAGEALFAAAPGGFPGGVEAAFGGLQVRLLCAEGTRLPSSIASLARLHRGAACESCKSANGGLLARYGGSSARYMMPGPSQCLGESKRLWLLYEHACALSMSWHILPLCTRLASEDVWCAWQGFRAGGGGLGSGYVVDVTLRRALVCRAPPPEDAG